tara:strand:- start:49 stop:681 length:633 start_codon:yes stop_codon:yes gene_type:complete
MVFKIKKIVFCIFIIFSATIYGQKRINSTLDTVGVKGIFIDSDAVFKAEISAAPTDKITITSGIEGETFETFLINTEVKNNLLNITSGRSPDYEKIDDKLAAHKVMSVVLSITVPEGFELWVKSALASISAVGRFDYINFNLSSGDCRLDDFIGSGVINTETGNILAKTQNCKISAHTRNGKMVVDNIDAGQHSLTLTSIDGNIAVVQSK